MEYLSLICNEHIPHYLFVSVIVEVMYEFEGKNGSSREADPDNAT